MISALILHSDIKVIDAGQQAAALGQGLFITARGQVVIAPHRQTGWTRIAVRIKSPRAGTLETLPCAA